MPLLVIKNPVPSKGHLILDDREKRNPSVIFVNHVESSHPLPFHEFVKEILNE